MMSVGALAFLNPWILAGLLAVPILWWLLRAVPPAPRSQTFAGVRLLLGLEDEERQTDKTPWWLLLLRCLVVAFAILGFSQPVLNMTQRIAGGPGTLLVLMDQGWASAPDWDERKAAARAVLQEAADAGQSVVFWRAADIAAGGDTPPVVSADEALNELAATQVRTWAPDHGRLLEDLESGALEISGAVWLHAGLSQEETPALLDALEDAGSLRLIGPETVAKAVTPPALQGGRLTTRILSPDDSGEGVQVLAMAAAEGGGERRIAVATGELDEEGRVTASFDLPAELRGTVTRIALADRPSAGGAAFTDGAIRRISAGMVVADVDAVVTTLTSPTHYLEQAIVPWADIIRTDVQEAVARDVPMVVMTDHGNLPEDDRTALTEWVEAGGILVRFAGPRLAASIGSEGFGSAALDDPLLPVALRRGGRVLGGALAWSTPRALGPFAQEGPFRGLAAPDEVDVRTQVLAEPSPDLAKKVWASLDDGTPLVTAASLGEGTVILFHVSSDAEWSSLPLSGLFVEMLGRLSGLAAGRAAGLPDADALAGTLWRAETFMGPDGVPQPATGVEDAVRGEQLLAGAGAGLPPAVYIRADRGTRVPGEADSLVINLTTAETELQPFPAPGPSTVVETLGGVEPQRYGPWLLALAAVLIFADVIGTLFVSGRLATGTKAAALGLALIVFALPNHADAEDVSNEAIAVTAETTIAFVRTGESRIDRVSERALIGLGNALTRRTAIEPGPPIGVTPGEDELGFYPVLYWPLVASSLPNRDGLSAMSDYLRNGGMLIIDTQNGASGFGGASAVQMREIARLLSLPPLAPVDDDHVLTRAFYLLADFPGRWRGGRVWAEAPPPTTPGMPDNADIPQFDRVDDNVSPVIVGSADWASAWAVDERGAPLFPIGRPGDRQREMALRFGVNAVMYALTGNYKSDQVHAPAVLQRLGQ